MTALGQTLAIAAAVWTAASLAALAISVALALLRPAALRRRHVGPSSAEPVSVIIPVKLLDAGFAEAQASVLQGLPAGSEVIVTAREAASPALDAAHMIFAAAQIPVRFLRSTATFAVSPKIDNLVEAVEAAQHDIIFMKDSNIVVPLDGVAQALATLDDGVGLVCAIPRAIDAQNFPAAVEAQVMNQSHGRLLLMADALGLGFGVGKIMVFRRSVVSRIGGLAAVGHSVGEDSALSTALSQIGLRTAFMGPRITQALGARRWRDVFNRQMRWTAVRARNTKFAFALEPLGLCVVAASAAAFAAPLMGWSPLAAAVACLAVWFLLETALALAQGWDVSVTAPAVMVARDSLMLAVWVKAWFTRDVVWAGNRMPVSRTERTSTAATTRPLERGKPGRNV